MRGDRRSSIVLTDVVGVPGMLMTGGVVESGTGCVCVGGGVFARVWRPWICGAVRTMCGAVGFVDVGIVIGAPFEKGAPFECTGGVLSAAFQGIVVISCVGLNVNGVDVCRRSVVSMVVRRRCRAVRGRCSKQRTSSCATCSVCSMGESVGS